MTTAARRDLGNVVNCAITNQSTKKEHFKSSGGRRTKDYSVETQVGAQLKFALDEMTEDNVAMFARGTPEEQTDGSFVIEGFSDTVFEGLLEIIGDNEAGPQITWKGQVSLTAGGDFNFIQDSDEFNKIPIEADVIEDDTYGFGKWYVDGAETSPNKANYSIPTGKAYFTRTA